MWVYPLKIVSRGEDVVPLSRYYVVGVSVGAVPEPLHNKVFAEPGSEVRSRDPGVMIIL